MPVSQGGERPQLLASGVPSDGAPEVASCLGTEGLREGQEGIGEDDLLPRGSESLRSIESPRRARGDADTSSTEGA